MSKEGAEAIRREIEQLKSQIEQLGKDAKLYRSAGQPELAEIATQELQNDQAQLRRAQDMLAAEE